MGRLEDRLELGMGDYRRRADRLRAEVFSYRRLGRADKLGRLGNAAPPA